MVAQAFDEMGGGAELRPPYTAVSDWMAQTPAAIFEVKRREA